MTIGSQSSLSSLSRLHEVAATGGFHGVNSYSIINRNPMLPFADVELLKSLANGGTFDHCQNLGEPETNECYCPPT